MQTAGKGCPTLVKKLDSSGSVPLSLHDAEGVHLQTVVIVEAQRFMLNDPLVQLEARSAPVACGCADGRSRESAYRTFRPSC